MINTLNRTVIELKIGERFYKLECSPDSPLTELNQALVEMNNFIISKINEAQEAQANAISETQAE